MKTREEVLKLIENGLSYEEIKEELELSDSEILLSYYKLINKYKTDKSIAATEQLEREYIHNYSFKNFGGQRVLLLSDEHLGSIYENIEYHELLKDFIKENKIKTIINGGDIGDGLVKYKKDYSSYSSQIDHILKIHDDLSEIDQYIIGGNHDRRYKDHNEDIIRILDETYSKIHEEGYYQAYFNIYDKTISLEHHSEMQYNKLINKDLTIAGHAHKAVFKESKVLLPTMSDSMPSIDATLPGFMIMNSKKGKEKVIVQFDYYTFEKEDVKLSDKVEYDLGKTKVKK